MSRMHIERAIIIGATSGIGRAVAVALVERGVRVGVAGRRTERLEELQQRYGVDRVAIAAMDVTSPTAVEAFDRLVQEVGAPDMVLYASGIGKQNPDLDADMEIAMVRTNCEGMVRIVDHVVNYVKRNNDYYAKRKPHLAVISSVAGTMGMGQAPAYSATKSMQSAYMVAMAQHMRMQHIPLSVSDIRPGFVATEILNPEKHYPMMMSAEKAARHILRGIYRRRRIIIFDWRYRLLVAFWRSIPRCIWERLTIVKN